MDIRIQHYYVQVESSQDVQCLTKIESEVFTETTGAGQGHRNGVRHSGQEISIYFKSGRNCSYLRRGKEKTTKYVGKILKAHETGIVIILYSVSFY